MILFSQVEHFSSFHFALGIGMSSDIEDLLKEYRRRRRCCKKEKKKKEGKHNFFLLFCRLPLCLQFKYADERFEPKTCFFFFFF